MRFTYSLLATAAALSSLVMRAQAKAVFAHFIVGNAGAFVQDDWDYDVQQAAAVGIDGFALNFAGDSYSDTQLGYAYKAAENQGNFTVFLMFDYDANDGLISHATPGAIPFTQENVQDWINKYKVQKGQFNYNGQPLVGTFEGVGNASDWVGIKANTGCFFVPDWTSAKGDAGQFQNVDGALSWDVWPNGPTGISTMIDTAWQAILGDKVYMMGVSPWFYTNLPGKNWLWRGDNLWHDRWQQVLEIQPELVEILTWNDFGESHYIGPLHPSEYPPGSESYVQANPHDGWRNLLPYYIHAYKNGNTSSLAVTEEQIIYAHKPNPSASGSTDGTMGNPTYQPPQYPPSQVSLDAISLDVIVAEPSDVSVQIGDNPPTLLQATTAGPNHFLVYFNGQTGNVTYTVSRNGQVVVSTTGAAITEDCADGTVNWNAVVGTS